MGVLEILVASVAMDGKQNVFQRPVRVLEDVLVGRHVGEFSLLGLTRCFQLLCF